MAKRARKTDGSATTASATETPITGAYGIRPVISVHNESSRTLTLADGLSVKAGGVASLTLTEYTASQPQLLNASVRIEHGSVRYPLRTGG